jgi:hypothetical protein
MNREQATRCAPREIAYYRKHRRWPDIGNTLPPITALDLLVSAILLAGILSLLYITK